MRAHLYRVITDDSGQVQTGSAVRVLQPDTDPTSGLLVTDTVYAHKADPTVLGASFVTDSGVVDIWMDHAQFVQLGITPPGGVEYFVNNVAVADYVTPASAAPVSIVRCTLSAPTGSGSGNALNAQAGVSNVPWNLFNVVGQSSVNWLTANADGTLTLAPGYYSLAMLVDVAFTANAPARVAPHLGTDPLGSTLWGDTWRVVPQSVNVPGGSPGNYPVVSQQFVCGPFTFDDSAGHTIDPRLSWPAPDVSQTVSSVDDTTAPATMTLVLTKWA